MSFIKAKKALAEIRNQHITARSNPVDWDISLALEEMCKELDMRLAQIEQNQTHLSRQIASLQR